jgi:hypothetical protein
MYQIKDGLWGSVDPGTQRRHWQCGEWQLPGAGERAHDGALTKGHACRAACPARLAWP